MKTSKWIFLALILSAATAVIEYLLFGFQGNANASLIMRKGLSSLPIILALTAGKTKSYKLTSIIFSIFYLTQLWHIDFFHNPLQPELMSMIFDEPKEIALGLQSKIFSPNILYETIASIFLLTSLLKIQSVGPSRSPKPLALCLACLIISAYGAESTQKLRPRLYGSALENTLRAYEGFLLVYIPRRLSGQIQTRAIPEKIEEIASAKKSETVVLIIGESTSALRLSALGYKKSTTPQIDHMIQAGKMKVWQGTAGAVATITAIPALLLCLNDPRDINALTKQNGNILSIAKKSGYTVHLWSAQSSNVYDRINLESVDDLKLADSDKTMDRYGEIYMLKLLKTLPTSGRHFVVMHFRVGHVPYEFSQKVRPHKIAKDPTSIESYEGALRTIDWLIDHAHQSISQRHSYQFFFTSDHGENFGEDKWYGHAKLLKSIAQIPIIYDGMPNIFSAGISKYKTPNHYDLTKAVALSMGYKIERGGDSKGYINGTGYAGSAGLIEYDRF